MINSATLARWEGRLRPLLARLPPSLAVQLYSRGRQRFLSRYSQQVPSASPRAVPEALGRTLWGLQFRSSLFNAAGMFKNGDGYQVTWHQGAGAYLAGTTTHRQRRGNPGLPFAPYPRSGSASNFLGLPNLGHQAVAGRLASLPRHAGFPIGASVAAPSEDAPSEEERLAHQIAGLKLYEQAGVDFLEINESCPNTEDDLAGLDALRKRLSILRDGFLDHRERRLPVLVKFSCDTATAQVAELIDLLVELGFDGVNFGNTSIAYPDLRQEIAQPERRLFDHFVQRFKGGVSGRPLKRRSLDLTTAATAHLRAHPPEHEFHVIRTGGLENAGDLRFSEDAGASLSQWYSGYFEAFGRHGHGLYQRLYANLDTR